MVKDLILSSALDFAALPEGGQPNCKTVHYSHIFLWQPAWYWQVLMATDLNTILTMTLSRGIFKVSVVYLEFHFVLLSVINTGRGKRL